MKILKISDTHNRHQQLINLPGADGVSPKTQLQAYTLKRIIS